MGHLARVAFSVLIMSLVAVASFAQSYGTNLIVNPGADAQVADADCNAAASVPGWTLNANFSDCAPDDPAFGLAPNGPSRQSSRPT